MKKAFKFLHYPTKQQEQTLFWTLSRCREVYNAALAERKHAYQMAGKSVSSSEQKRDLPQIKAEIRQEYQHIHSQVLQDVLLRLDRAFKAFFRRVKNGENPGYPRLQGRHRYDSFTSPQAGGFSLTHDNRVCLSKIGTIRLTLHRKIEGTPKTCTIKADLKRKQQAVSRKKRGSHRREKARKQVAKAHRKMANQRGDFHHKQANKLVVAHQVIIFEDLQLTNLVRRRSAKQDEDGTYLPNGAAAKGGLNKSLLDHGLGQFVQIVMHKAACAGREVYQMNPSKTSQICSACGNIGPHKDLSERVHLCIYCGVVLDRDENAAHTIYLAWKEPTHWASLCRGPDQCVEAPR
jgi:putative transposase